MNALQTQDWKNLGLLFAAVFFLVGDFAFEGCSQNRVWKQKPGYPVHLVVPAVIFCYTQSTQSGGWKGILLYQQLMGSVFGSQVAKGYFLKQLLQLPCFSPGTGDGPSCFVSAGAGVASGQRHVSGKRGESHRPGPDPSSNPRKSLVRVRRLPPPSFRFLACLPWKVFLTDLVQASPPIPFAYGKYDLRQVESTFAYPLVEAMSHIGPTAFFFP